MSFLQLVLKQMRQRALATWLTLLSVLLGVALAIAVMMVQREGSKLLGQGDWGYDMVVGPKGSELQLVLATTFHMGKAQSTIPYAYYEVFPNNLPPEYAGELRWKLPIAFGDNYQGHRIVGTTTAILGLDESGRPLPPGATFEYRRGRRLELAEGREFHRAKFEAVIGSEVAARTGLKLNSTFKATHGTSADERADEHDLQWTVVGILKPTHTANDRVLFIPLVSFYTIPGHDLEAISRIADRAATGPATRDAHEAHDDHDRTHEVRPDGTIELEIPKSRWRLSAILCASAGGIVGDQIAYAVNNGPEAMAVNPAREMAAFTQTYLAPGTKVLLVLAVLVTVVAAVGILVSIYNSTSARRRDIAILRALGATRRRVLSLICAEAGLLGFLGGTAGLILAHVGCGVASIFVRQWLGEGLAWLVVDAGELLYLLAVTALAALAGLVPALKAYRTPVATNLVLS